MSCVKSTWDMAALTEAYHMNFAVRYTVAVLIGVAYAIELCNWVGTTAVVATLLISTRVGPDVQASLNALVAVVAASLLSAILFDHACMTGYGDYAVPLSGFLFWFITLYAYWSQSKFATIGLLGAALGAPRLVALCPKTGDTSAGAAGLWNALINVFFSIAITSFCEVAFAVDRSSTLAVNALNDAFKNLQ